MATVAVMATPFVRLEKAAIIRVIHIEPAFSELFIAHLLDRTIRVEADLVDQLFNSSEKRLARLLLLLANFGKEGKPEPLIAKISQETLAEMIGTTRSRVSFFMKISGASGFGKSAPRQTFVRGLSLFDLSEMSAPLTSPLWPQPSHLQPPIWLRLSALRRWRDQAPSAPP